MKRPEWFEPVNGIGERIGFLGGIVVALAGVAFAVLLAKGIINHASVGVRNDTRAWVRIAGCVDDAADIGPGETFQAEGQPEGDELACLVSNSKGNDQRCMAIPRVRSVHGTIALSRLNIVRVSRCD